MIKIGIGTGVGGVISWIFYFFAVGFLSPVFAQIERECGQDLDFVSEKIVQATCLERDLNQQLASCRTCKNVAYVGIIGAFAGLADNINGHNTRRYHIWQFLGQTSAGYLLYTTNTSRGGLLRAWGLMWSTNAIFQAVVNRAAGLCGDGGGICWTDAEASTYDLAGFDYPKLWHGSSRRVQLGVGLILIATGLTLDVIDHFAPSTGRSYRIDVQPGVISVTF